MFSIQEITQLDDIVIDARRRNAEFAKRTGHCSSRRIRTEADRRRFERAAVAAHIVTETRALATAIEAAR